MQPLASLKSHVFRTGILAPVTQLASTRQHSRARSSATGPSPAADVSALDGRTCFINGASRGLGLEFVRQLLQLPETRVIGSCRQPNAAADLQSLAVAHPGRLHLLQLDHAVPESITAACAAAAQLTGHIDLLVNAAGVLHVPGSFSPETSLARVNYDQLLLSLQTNAMGPLLVCQGLAPLLVAASTQGRASAAQPAIIANMSARVGSIGDNRLGGWYSYRASKAALNQLSVTLALEFERRRQNVAVIMLHPGTCDTDLSKPFQKNVPAEKLFSQDRGVRQLLGLIASTQLKDNGRFLAWDGQEVPW